MKNFSLMMMVVAIAMFSFVGIGYADSVTIDGSSGVTVGGISGTQWSNGVAYHGTGYVNSGSALNINAVSVGTQANGSVAITGGSSSCGGIGVFGAVAKGDLKANVGSACIGGSYFTGSLVVVKGH